MNILESIRVALRGLAANKLRAGLTMLGVIIGVTAVVALLSIGQGAQAAITQQIQGIGSNLIFVIPGAYQQGGIRAALGSAGTLTLEDAEALSAPQNAPNVRSVAPVVASNMQVVFESENVNTLITGTTPDWLPVRNFRLRSGRFIEKEDVDTLARVAVLGSLTAQNLFHGGDPIGRTIKIQRVPFRVVGILEERGGSSFMGGSQDDLILIPITTAQARLLGVRIAPGGGRRVTSIYASAVNENRIPAALEEITLILRQRHKIQYEDDDFTVMSQQDILGAFDQITSILTIFLGAIAAISLLVGGIGIMNIMLVSVTERTREIGLRKAVGAKRRDILAQFLIEAIVLSVVGGLVGVLLGIGAAKTVDATGAMQTVVSLQSITLAVGFSVAVGLVFGIYPAVRAARLNPIDALRYE